MSKNERLGEGSDFFFKPAEGGGWDVVALVDTKLLGWEELDQVDREASPHTPSSGRQHIYDYPGGAAGTIFEWRTDAGMRGQR